MKSNSVSHCRHFLFGSELVCDSVPSSSDIISKCSCRYFCIVKVHGLDADMWKDVEVIHIDIADKSQVETKVRAVVCSLFIFCNSPALVMS